MRNNNKSYDEIVKEWQSKPIQTEQDLETALSNFRILFAYHSNVIENEEVTYHDTREIFENGKVINFTGDLRTLFEIKNQKICFDFLKKPILQKEILTEEFVKKVHKRLMDGCYDEVRYEKGERPGKYKIHDYGVGDGIGAYPEDVAEEMQDLLNEINEFTGKNILTAAAYFHLRFESIHPFADGNGRVGRTLMNYFLMTHNHPPMIIYNEDKQTYYMALSVFDKTEEISGFVRFLKEQTEKTWNRKRCDKISLCEHTDKYE